METHSPVTATHQSIQDSGLRKAIAFTAFIALLAAPTIFFVMVQRSMNQRTLHSGESLPERELIVSSQGREILARIRRKDAAIFFFNTSCPHCQREIPILNEAWKRFGGDVEFVAVALNSEEKVRSFVKTTDVRIDVIVDEKGSLRKAFDVSELPSLFLVNRDEKVHWIGTGEQSREEIVRRLASLIKEKTSE